MADGINVVKSYQTAEGGKFVELVDNAQFPPVSVIRWSYPDTTTAFPKNSAAKPLSSVDIYPKYAVLSYIANPESISVAVSTGDVQMDLTSVNTRLNYLTAYDYSTSAKQDITNTLLNELTAKETTISLDVSAINVNTDGIEHKLDVSNSLLDSISGNVFDIETLVTTSNNTLNNISNYTYNASIYTDNIRNSIFDGIGGYPGSSLGVYTVGRHLFAYQQQLSSVNSLLSSMDITLKNGLNVTGGGSGDVAVKKLTTTSLTNTFTTPSANRIYNIFGVSTANIGQYIQIYDITNSTPVGTPAALLYVPANSNFNFEFAKGIPFTSNNALLVNSLTPIDYNPGNSDLFITVIYN